MKGKKNIIFCVLLVLAICLGTVQSYRLSKLESSLDRLDSRVAMEFDAARSMLSLEFREREYTANLARKIEKLEMVTLYGYYLEGFSGGDAQWCVLAQAIGELNDPEIFALLSGADCDMIADFLDGHEYVNRPAITGEEISPVLELIEDAVEKHTAA